MQRTTTLIAILSIAIITGCGREYYRKQADAEVYDLVAEKSNHPHWRLENYTIKIDPRSRMYFPFDQDRPPMPIDDPMSQQLMHCIDGKNHYPAWDYNGFTDQSDNHDFINYLPFDESGVVVLSADEAVRIALLNSTNYQNQLETIYLSAVDVSSERFRFDTQFFGGVNADLSHTGRLVSGNSQTNASVGTRNTRLSRLYSTGATLAVNLANTFMWQLSGPDTSTAQTLVDFTFIQPFLRQAGRDFILEQLTIAERALLANVRQMERFRRGFYLNIVVGTGSQPGPQRRGGFFGAPGLGGFTGVGGGGFGGVGGATFGGGGGGAGAGNAGGYLGLLQQQQQIRNQVANIASLRSSLAQLEAFREANRIDFFQVEQIRQQLFQATSQLLNSRRGYQDTLDGFKATLGIPPQIKIRVEDRLLDNFNLIDPQIIPYQSAVSGLQAEVGNTILKVLEAADPNEDADPQAVVAMTPQMQQLFGTISNAIARSQALRREILTKQLPRAKGDVQRVVRTTPERQEAATQLRESIADNSDVDPSLFDTGYLKELPAELNKQITDVQLRLDNNSMKADQFLEGIKMIAGQQQPQIAQIRNVLRAGPSVLTDLSADLLELSLIQARARSESVTLVGIDITPENALEIARKFRRDWMNARASLVDSWRSIEFVADQLESDLDVVFSGNISTVNDNPIKFRDHTGTLRVGLQFDAPLTRLNERNTYRQVLIDYQRARRQYYQNIDTIARSFRATLRQVELNKVNFELRRRALRVAVQQVQSARLRLEEPPVANAAGVGGSLGPTTAINLINALNTLRSAQDDFLSVWVNYEVQRGILDLNLGTMQLDTEGLWIDPGPIGDRFGYPNMATPYGDDCNTNAADAGINRYVPWDILGATATPPPMPTNLPMNQIPTPAEPGGSTPAIPAPVQPLPPTDTVPPMPPVPGAAPGGAPGIPAPMNMPQANAAGRNSSAVAGLPPVPSRMSPIPPGAANLQPQ